MSKNNSMTSLIARLGLGLALLSPVVPAAALEIGGLSLHSALGERLEAQIPLDLGATDPGKVRVRLASESEFATAGLPWSPVLNEITFTTVQRNGAYFVELHSTRPIDSPYLQFLLRVDWPGGRLLREYTALLDPPYLAKQEQLASATPALPVTAAPSAASLPAQAAAVTGQAPPVPGLAAQPLLGPAVKAPTPVTKPAKQAKAQAPRPQRVGPVKPGQSLWALAQGLQAREQTGVPQIMVALYQANRKEFAHDNMNGLKRGAVLKVPSAAAVLSISESEAARALRVQDAAWNGYRMRLAAHPLAVAGSAHAGSQSASGTVGATPSQAAPQTSDRLRILGVGKGSGSGLDGRKALQSDAASLQEALASKQLENKDLQGQVKLLEQQLADTRRLLTVEDRELAGLQAQIHASPAPVSRAHPVAKSVAVAPVAPPTTVTVAKVAPPKPVVAKPPLSKPHAPAKKIAPAPVPADSLFDDVMASPLFVPLAAALAVLLLALALYYRRRRQSIAEFEESILSGSVPTDAGHQGDEAGKQADVSFLSDFSQGGMGNIHTDEVDPIAEAEVYLAYGRDEQAEEILKEAIHKDPARQELKLRLLEVYHQRKDLPAFETLAEELYASTEGKGGRIWAKVEELGRKMNPNNPLFRHEGEAVGAEGRLGAQGSSLDLDTAALEPGSDADDGTHSLDVNTVTEAPPGRPEPSGSIEFSLDMPALSLEPDARPIEAVSFAEAAPEGEAFGGKPVPSFEFDLEFTADTASATMPPPEVLQDLGVTHTQGIAEGAGVTWSMEGNDSDVALDEPPEGEVTVNGSEAGTKLDLARAYLDMGDLEGARSALDEVLAEGTSEQKDEAKRLAAQLV